MTRKTTDNEVDITTAKGRLMLFLKAHNIPKSAMEQKCGFARSHLSKIASLSCDFLEKVCREYPTLNPAWVVDGRGEMTGTDTEALARATYDLEEMRKYCALFKALEQSYKSQIVQLTSQNEFLREQVAALEKKIQDTSTSLAI